MVVSVNSEPDREVFDTLLQKTVITLKNESISHAEKYSNLLGNKLEEVVCDIITDNAKGTPFDGSIELISGQRFPDIIAKNYYGVEVKTTKSNHWKSTGSSIAEGTRIEGIERIFMLFGKMCDPIDFMCRPYEDCLSDVVVTHSPRYLIDMNLKEGETIFDKIKTPYDVLRKQENPIETVLDYYRGNMKSGQTTWWTSKENKSKKSKVIVRLWSSAEEVEQKLCIVKAYCLFPELLGRDKSRYTRMTLWLCTEEGILCPNIRDQFSAGGQGTIPFNGSNYSGIPRTICNLVMCLNEIKSSLQDFDFDVLEDYWGVKVKNNELYNQWCELVSSKAKEISTTFPLKEYLQTM